MDGEDIPARPLRPAAPSGPVPAARADPPSGPEPAAASRADPPSGTEPTAENRADPQSGPEPAAAAGDAGPRPVRVALARAVRRIPPPRRAAASSTRALRAWSRRPTGRVALPALLMFALVALAGGAGAFLVPAAARSPRPAAVEPSPGGGSGGPDSSRPAPTPPGGPAAPTGAAATPAPTGTAAATPGGVGQPADVLADWAQGTGVRVGVPAVAMRAYGYAELVLARTTPVCRLSWTTLAAIGLVESGHGSANGAALTAAGRTVPPIIGLPLDGNGGRQRILDTDAGRFDGDIQYDRAVGPMQFIPTTWRVYGVDADGDGQQDPQNIFDSALAAGNYLCNGGRDMSTAADWWAAILSYNEVRPYAQSVYDAANRYGIASRT